MVTILCPTDFSLWSENAVKYAYELAQLMRARLILLHCKSALAQPVAAMEGVLAYNQPSTDPEQAEEQELLHKLKELKQKLEANNPENAVPLKLIQKKGLLQETIQSLIEQENVELVIIGHKEAGDLQVVMTEEGLIVNNATCPVLLIPQQAAFKPLWKIIYATGLKREPAADCVFLLKLAHLFNAEIMLLHILKQDIVGAREFATEELQKVYSKLPYRNVSYYLEANENIEDGISKFVLENKADLLVLSSYPKIKLQHLLPGKHPYNEPHHTQLPMLIRRHASKLVTA